MVTWLKNKIQKNNRERNNYINALLPFIPLIVLYEICVLYFINLDHSVWGDERHFYNTILFFKDFDLSKIADYKEVTPPFTYLIYALWGKVVGFEISSLRILSIIISTGIAFFLHYLIFSLFQKRSFAILGTLLFIFNPYVIGMSIFIYTDMLAVLFVIILLIGILKNNIILIFFSSCFSILTRQYNIVFLIAAVIYFFFLYLEKGEKKNLFNIIAVIVSTFPLIFLFYIWGGISPPTGAKYWIGNNSLQYNLNSLSTYLSIIPIYTLPLFAVVSWRNKENWKFYIVFFAIGLIYFFFRVEASNVTLTQTDLTTVGLFHKSLQNIVGDGFIQHIIFYFFFVMGLWFIYKVVCRFWRKIKTRTTNWFSFGEMTIMFYLLIMPFSYQIWEKYILILLPSIIVYLFELYIAKDNNQTKL